MEKIIVGHFRDLRVNVSFFVFVVNQANGEFQKNVKKLQQQVKVSYSQISTADNALQLSQHFLSV